MGNCFDSCSAVLQALGDKEGKGSLLRSNEGSDSPYLHTARWEDVCQVGGTTVLLQLLTSVKPPPAPPSCPTPPAPPLRLQLLLAEVHQLSGDMSQALVVATETVRQCAEHNWKDLVVQGKLLIAQLQVSTLRCTGVSGFQFQLSSAISHMIAVLEQWSPMWYTPLEFMRDSTTPMLESRHWSQCAVRPLK